MNLLKNINLKPENGHFLSFTMVGLLLIASFSVATAQTQLSLSVGGTANDQGFAIVQTADSGYVIAGQTGSFGAGANDMYVVKFNKAGKLLWTRTIGGSANETGRSMVLASDGGFVIAGQTSSFGSGGEDVLLTKLDASGNLIWSKAYGGTGSDIAWEVISTSDGGYAVAGVSNSAPAKGQDMYLLKVDKDGVYQWDRMVDSKSDAQYTLNDIGYSVAQMNDGGLVICGTHFFFNPSDFSQNNTNGFLAKFDLNGNKLWSKSFVDPAGSKYYEYPKSIAATSDGGFILGMEAGLPCESGFVECNSPGSINWHYYVAKFDASANIQWTKFYGGGTVSGVSADATDYLRSVIQTKDGGYVIGGHSYAFRKDFSSNTQKGTEFYIVKLTSSGSLEWSKVIGGTGMDNGNAIIQTAEGGYAFAGYTSPAGQGGDELTLIVTDASGNSCQSNRTGCKFLGSGGSLTDLGIAFNGSAKTVSGGTSGSGGLRTDFCALSLTIDLSANKTCGTKCTGSASASASGGTPPYSYSWQPGSYNSPTINALCAGNYTVTVTDNAGNSGSKSVSIAQDNFPKAGFTYQQGSGYSVQFSDTSKYAISWFWDFGKLNTPNPVTSKQQSPFITFPYDNIYPVKLVVSNSCGKDSITINVNVLKKTAIDDLTQTLNEIKISPNPANGICNISAGDGRKLDFTCSIFNITGQMIYRDYFSASSGWEKKIDLSNKPAGLYKVVFESGNKIQTKNLMVH